MAVAKCVRRSRQILLPGGKHLFLYDIDKSLLREIPSSFADSAKMDAKFSPGGEFVSFVSKGDIFVTHLASGIERRVTFSSQPQDDKSGTSTGVTSGIAEFIMQEEFSRFTGYWWSPTKNSDGEFLICYLEVDESAVPTALISSAGEEFAVDEYRYPRPGNDRASLPARISLLMQYNSRCQCRGEQCEIHVVFCSHQVFGIRIRHQSDDQTVARLA